MATQVMQTIYLAGPMTGLPDYNAPAFAAYAAKYRALGHVVLSPPEMDAGDYTQPYEYYIRRDLEALIHGVTEVRLLPGWRASKGACLEKHVAETLGIPVFDAETGEPVARGGSW